MANALAHGRQIICVGFNCGQCEFRGSCNRKRFKWAYDEYVDKPKLTVKERDFCELAETGWIARDEDGRICYYEEKPIKQNEFLSWTVMNSVGMYLKNKSKINFPFIKWEDEEAWSVEDLLKLEVEE